MAERITITPNELRVSSSNLRAKADDISSILQYVLYEVRNLESTWDGAAQDAFFIQFNELHSVLKQYPEILQGMASQLDVVASILEDTDNELVSQLSL